MKVLQVGVVSASMLSVVVLGGAAAANARATPAKALVPVEFTGPANPPPNVVPVPSGLAGYAISLGKINSIFARYGFKYAGYAPFENTTLADAAISAGSAQLISQGQAPAVLAKAGGVPLTVIGAGADPDSTWILVPKNSPITNVDQLQGKTIGVGFGTNFEEGLLWALNHANIKDSQVTLSNIVINDGEAALASGDIDAYSTSSSLGVIWAEAGYPVIWKSQAHPQDVAANVTMVQSSFAKAHPKIQDAWWALYEAGLAAFKKDKSAYYAWVGEQSGITGAQAEITSPVVVQTTAIEPSAVSVLNQAEKFFLAAGQATSSFSVSKWLIAPAGKFAS